MALTYTAPICRAFINSLQWCIMMAAMVEIKVLKPVREGQFQSFRCNITAVFGNVQNCLRKSVLSQGAAFSEIGISLRQKTEMAFFALGLCSCVLLFLLEKSIIEGRGTWWQWWNTKSAQEIDNQERVG